MELKAKVNNCEDQNIFKLNFVLASEADSKRRHIVQEFIDTENSYKADLKNVVEVCV